MRRMLTPSQTVGPFFSIGLVWPDGHGLHVGDAGVAAIEVSGRVLDGGGQPVTDALLEIWQADAAGTYGADNAAMFRGFGRAATAGDGSYRFVTVKPGPVPGSGRRPQAPHINMAVFARGLLRHLYTRIYFADEAAANAADEVLARVPVVRRPTLVASRSSAGYTFDVRLQGAGETVFFEF